MKTALEEAFGAAHLSLRRGEAASLPASEGRRGSLESLRGRLVQLDGGAGAEAGAGLTFAAAYLREAQGAGEPVAWVSEAGPGSSFFPADLLAWGIDLAALPVVRAKGRREAFATADKLLRSGAFGLLVLDFEGPGELPLPVQTRLSGLVQKHEATVIFLTERDPETESLGSLLSLRLHCRWRREGGRFHCRAEAIKDKRLGPGWSREIVVDGAPGLR